MRCSIILSLFLCMFLSFNHKNNTTKIKIIAQSKTTNRKRIFSLYNTIKYEIVCLIDSFVAVAVVVIVAAVGVPSPLLTPLCLSLSLPLCR